jgi:hypothetical protein
MHSKNDPLSGLTSPELRTMLALLRAPAEQQKDAPKPATKRGESQRRRRLAERRTALTDDAGTKSRTST